METDQNEPIQTNLLDILKFSKIKSLFFDKLSLQNLSRLSSTCKRLNSLVQNYIEELQLTIADDHGVHSLQHLQNNHVVLKSFNPDYFLFPNPPFQAVKKLFLSFNGENCGKINLIHLPLLTHLKIRGPLIQLSSNRLPTVTHVDIENVDCCEKQVFPNVENFFLEFDVEELSQVYNSTENKALEHIFIKAFDILTNKTKIQHIKFMLSLYMEILVFEKFIDSIETFLKCYQQQNDEGRITVILKHTKNYVKESEKDEGLRRRFDAAFRRLEVILPNLHYNFKIVLKT